MRNKRLAFTLFDTMVVVTIVVLLAAILFPVVGKAKDRAQHAVCWSNLKQLGVGINLYAQDHSGYMPYYTNVERLIFLVDTDYSALVVPTNSEQPHMLKESLNPYIKNDQVWFCPNDPVKGQDIYYLGIRHQYTSYVLTGIFGRLASGGEPYGVSRNLDTMPSEEVIIGDSSSSETDSDYWPYGEVPVATMHPDNWQNLLRADLSLHRINLNAQEYSLIPGEPLQ